jgi:F0F1-type ATP synthase assembly protein I
MNDQPENNSEKQSHGNRKSMQVAWIPLQAGCLTFVLAVVAILIGLWLDTRLGTAPRWTLILLIGSAPFAMGGVYLIVRRALRRLRADTDPIELEEQP